MTAVAAIAASTLREAVRDRVLYLILFFAVLVILGSEGIAALAVGAPEKVVLDVGLAAISLTGVLVSVFLGLSLVSREIERRTVYTLVSRPIPRGAFVAGKLAGLLATVALVVAGMSAVFLAHAWLRYDAATPALLGAIALGMVENLVIASFALLFSSFSTPILGTVFTLTAYVVGHLSYGLRMLAEFPQVRDGAWRQVLLALYYLLPNLERFNVRAEAVHGDPVGWAWLAASAAYGTCYAAAVAALAAAIFARRDLT